MMKHKLQQTCLLLEQNPSSFWDVLEDDRYTVSLLSGGLLPFLAVHMRQLSGNERLHSFQKLWGVLNKNLLIETRKIEARDLIAAFLEEGFLHSDTDFIQVFCKFYKTYPFSPKDKHLSLLEMMVLTYGSKDFGKSPQTVVEQMIDLFEAKIITNDTFKSFVQHIIQKDSFAFLPVLLDHRKYKALELERIINIDGLIQQSLQNHQDLLKPIFSPAYQHRYIFEHSQERIIQYLKDSFPFWYGEHFNETDQKALEKYPTYKMIYHWWIENFDDPHYIKVMSRTPSFFGRKMMEDTTGRKERLKPLLIDHHPEVLEQMGEYYKWVIGGSIHKKTVAPSKLKKM